MAVSKINEKITVKEYKERAWQQDIKLATVIFNGEKFYNSQASLVNDLLVDYIECSHGDVYIYAKAQ